MTTNYKIETYNLTTASGRHIRQATRVIRLSDGARVSFTEKLPKQEAVIAAEREWSKSKR